MRKHQLEAELARVTDAWEQDQKLNATLTAARDARIAELAAENARLEEIVRSREEVINQISNVISGYRMAFVLVDEAYTMEDDKETNFIVDPEPITARLNPNPSPITTKRAYEVARFFGWSNSELFAAARELGLAHIVEERDWVTANEAAQLNDHIKAKSTKED